MMAEFLKRILTVFLDWVIPVSRQANPRCIMKTRHVANKIQRLCVVNDKLARSFSRPHEFESGTKAIKTRIIFLNFDNLILSFIKLTLINSFGKQIMKFISEP